MCEISPPRNVRKAPPMKYFYHGYLNKTITIPTDLLTSTEELPWGPDPRQSYGYLKNVGNEKKFFGGKKT